MAAFTFPVSTNYTISSYFGQRNTEIKGASTNHQGIDIAVPIGTSVLSAAAGTVSKVTYNASRGNYVEVTHSNGFTTIYQHLSKANVKVGDTVTQGQTIALSGNTGVSSGAHLHFEVKQNGNAVNPLTLNMSTSGGQSFESITETNENIDELVNMIKEKWYLFAVALILLAVLK